MGWRFEKLEEEIINAIQIYSGEMKANIESIEFDTILNKFGDEKSNLVDRYERLSFEIQLNQAMLARCLSDHSYNNYSTNIINPGLARTRSVVVPPSKEELAPASKEGTWVFKKALKRMVKPMLLLAGKYSRVKVKHNRQLGDDDDHEILKIKKHPWQSWNKSFSRSARL